MLRRLRIGADQTENPISLIRSRSPDLRAIDYVLVAVLHGPRLQAGEIRPGIRFAVPLTPPDLATGDLREMFTLLLLRAEFQQCRADHADAHALQRRSRVDPAQFLLKDQMLFGVETSTAILGRPGGNRPAFLGHDLQPLLGFRIPVRCMPAAPDELVGRHRRADARRAVLLQPATGFFPERTHQPS